MAGGWRYVILVFVAVVVAHWPTIQAPLMFDDIHQIRDNPAMLDPGSLGRFFTDPGVGSNTGLGAFYRPLLFLTFLADGMVGAGSPVPFRVTSLLLLLALALSVRAFCRDFLRSWTGSVDERVPAMAGLLIACHPLLNETVLLATSRSSLLYGVFGLNALRLILSDENSPARSSLSAVLCVAALLSKETSVTLGPLAVLCVVLVHRGSFRRRVVACLPIVIPVAVYVVVHQLWLWQVDSTAIMPQSLQNPMPRLLAGARGGWALLGFFKLLLVPIGMAPDHPVPFPSGISTLFGFAVWPTAVVAGVGLMMTSRLRLVGAAILWFVIAMMPSLTLVALNGPLAEHRAVLAVVLPFAAVSDRVFSIPRERLAMGVGSAILAALGILACVQSIPWQSPIKMWTHAVTVEPGSARSWASLAEERAEAGNTQSALEAQYRALELSPGFPLYLANAAVYELRLGRLDRAHELARRGLNGDEGIPSLHRSMAECLARGGHVGEALPHARRAVEIDPDSTESWNGLGNVLWMAGLLDEAVQSYAEALNIDPENAEAAANLSRLRSQGRPTVEPGGPSERK